jgi:hypothetical protein
MPDAEKLILFEPWNMGDALIAAAIALQDPTRLAIACNPHWHPLIRAAAEGLTRPELLAVDLDYVSRSRTGRWNPGPLTVISTAATPVATIRGDIRDYTAAKKLFPNASIRSNGWLAFTARRSTLLDLPFARGWLPVRNRYRAWAAITSTPWQLVERFYQQKLPTPPSPLVTIHIGAQWRSKQYPHVAKLAELLTKTHQVQIVAAPADPLPDGIAAAPHVIGNDSGPMRLAAILRCHTHPIARISPIEEWLPPETIPIEAKATPKGYRPHPAYMSDTIIEGWPSPEDILDQLSHHH